MQLAEMKQMQNVIEQLEKKLGMETGTCLRLQMEKESLDEALSRLKRADSWEKRWKAGTSGRGIGEIELTDMTLPPRLVSCLCIINCRQCISGLRFRPQVRSQ